MHSKFAIFFSIGLIMITLNTLSQVYSTPELKAKEEQDLKEKLITNPQINSIDSTSINNLSAGSSNTKFILKNYPGYYKLKSVKLDSINKKNHINIYHDLKKEALSITKVETAWLSFENKEMIFVKLKTGIEGHLSFEIVDNKIIFTCRKCEVNNFNILMRSDKKAILLTKEPDGNPCYHKYKFKKTK